MKINIKASKTTLTDSIKNAIEEKLSVIENFLRPENVIHVEIDEDDKHTSGRFSRVEIRIAPGNKYADARGNDFYEALDLAIPKIREQLVKEKDKKISLRKRVRAWFGR